MTEFWYGPCDICGAEIRKERGGSGLCVSCWEFYEEDGGPKLDADERPPETLANHPASKEAN
jgi:hypothetical protein